MEPQRVSPLMRLVACGCTLKPPDHLLTPVARAGIAQKATIGACITVPRMCSSLHDKRLLQVVVKSVIRIVDRAGKVRPFRRLGRVKVSSG